MANMIVICFDRYPISEKERSRIEILNIVFGFILAVEMIIKLVGLGPRVYVRDQFNVLDGVITLVTLVDIAFYFAPETSTNFLAIFKSLRMLRMIKIARQIKRVNDYCTKLIVSLGQFLDFLVLMLIIFLVFVIAGMQLFAGSAYVDADNNPVS